jgi:tRNA threonylcarbamoyladenosine biosynthesis protein TsaB
MTRSATTVILALDTSTRIVGVAIYDGCRVLSESTWTSQDYHTVELAPAVAEAFRKTGLDIDGLGVIAVAIGPGSFTGLRVGLALAKGLALARRIPLIGISTMDIMATAQPLLTIPMAIVLRAGRGRLAVGWYRASEDGWKITGKMEIQTAEELEQEIKTPTLICGELTEEERSFLGRRHDQTRLASPAHSLRRPAFLAELAWKRWQNGEIDDAVSLAPIYLHYNESIPG